jgi:hypothetical protein
VYWAAALAVLMLPPPLRREIGPRRKRQTKSSSRLLMSPYSRQNLAAKSWRAESGAWPLQWDRAFFRRSYTNPPSALVPEPPFVGTFPPRQVSAPDGFRRDKFPHREDKSSTVMLKRELKSTSSQPVSLQTRTINATASSLKEH